jgi:hypothetical protein
METAEPVLVDDEIRRLQLELIEQVGIPGVADQDPAGSSVRSSYRCPD